MLERVDDPKVISLLGEDNFEARMVRVRRMELALKVENLKKSVEQANADIAKQNEEINASEEALRMKIESKYGLDDQDYALKFDGEEVRIELGSPESDNAKEETVLAEE